MGKKRICLDPGHYGEKYNAGVVSGYYESATVWKLTQYEKEYLEQIFEKPSFQGMVYLIQGKWFPP